MLLIVGYYAALLLTAAAPNESPGGRGGFTANPLLSGVDPNLLAWLVYALPLAFCIVFLAYTFSADRALDAQWRGRSQRNTLMALAILGAVLVAFFWLGSLLAVTISSHNLLRWRGALKSFGFSRSSWLEQRRRRSMPGRSASASGRLRWAPSRWPEPQLSLF